MNKTILSIAAISALAVSSFAASDLAGAFKEGKATGQIRIGYANQDMKDSTLTDTSAFAVGGKLGYTTGSLYGISAGVTAYTTQGMFKSNTDAKVQADMLDGRETGTAKSYSTLGEAYLVGQYGKTTVKVGRQVVDTPLAGSDDTRMIPNTFEAALVINTDLPDTTLIGGYVSRMAGHDSTSNKSPYTKFNSMSRSALGATVDTTLPTASAIEDRGVVVAAAIYAGVKDLTVQAWNYYATDVLNAVYLQADYKLGLAKETSLTLSGQYYNENGIGRTKDFLKAAGAGKVDFSVYGVKAALGLDAIGLTPYIAYNSVSEQKDNGGGTYTLGAWGGYPEFAQMEESFLGTKNPNGMTSTKIGVDYNLEKLGLGNRTIGVAYGSFDYKDKYNGNTSTDLNVVDVVYTCTGALVKNLDAKIVYESIDGKLNTDDRRWVKVFFNYNF
jgi:imipenem/basic amino acid-specific outer membrane pore